MKINHQHVQKTSHSAQFRLVILALWTISGTSLVLAQQSTPATFPSATVAVQSLFEAVQSNNEQAITKILGAATDLTSSGDPGQDRVDRELFVQKYREMNRLGRDEDGSLTLYIGAENWPFPIPLVNEKGAWHFDPGTGQKELLYRRIGENELTAIATCQEFVEAKKHYFAGSVVDPADVTPASLVAKAASGSASSDPVLFHGYYFRLLQSGQAKANTPGGFALIAYPAQYRSSGVMTFVVTKNGVVYEKDLGANTGTVASSLTAFHKDATWRPTVEAN